MLDQLVQEAVHREFDRFVRALVIERNEQWMERRYLTFQEAAKTDEELAKVA